MLAEAFLSKKNSPIELGSEGWRQSQSYDSDSPFLLAFILPFCPTLTSCLFSDGHLFPSKRQCSSLGVGSSTRRLYNHESASLRTLVVALGIGRRHFAFAGEMSQWDDLNVIQTSTVTSRARVN